jgi:hypothetical protein
MRETDVTARTRRPTGLRRSLALVLGIGALLVQVMPATAATTWTKNLYTSSAFLYQDPYSNACTAASTMIMLNTIAYRHSGGPAFQWRPYRVQKSASTSDYRDMTSILYFERSHDTLSIRGSGSDPHGWRNALNAYGWGGSAMTDASKSVYQDLEYSSYETAIHAAVRAIARFEMPVGIVSWAGRHSQVMTGYVAEGEDPVKSDAFTIRSVYLSDPLRSDGLVNARVSYTSLVATGSWRIRFQRYREPDSPYDDRYRAGWRRSSVYASVGPSEWYNRWVIVVPTVGFVKPTDSTPGPTPTPAPTAAPSPTASPTPAASAGPSASPSAAASASPNSQGSAGTSADPNGGASG